MNKITINGKTLITSGKLVQVQNNKVCVDGKELTWAELESKTINIHVEGNVEELRVNCCSKVEVSGDVKTLETQSGDVVIKGNVSGDIRTQSGDVSCGNIAGSVKTQSGDIVRQ